MGVWLGNPGAGKSAAAGALALGVGFIGYQAVVTVQHVGQPIYLLPLEAGISVVAATLVAVVAAVALLRSGLVELSILAVVAAGLCAYGFITGFSIGPPLLLGGLVLVVFVLVRGALQPGGWLAAIGGLLLGFSSAFVLFMASSPPAVRWGPRGEVATSDGYWPRLGGASGGGTASGGSGGRSTGTFSVGTTTVQYACENGQLAEFRVERAR